MLPFVAPWCTSACAYLGLCALRLSLLTLTSCPHLGLRCLRVRWRYAGGQSTLPNGAQGSLHVLPRAGEHDQGRDDCERRAPSSSGVKYERTLAVVRVRGRRGGGTHLPIRTTRGTTPPTSSLRATTAAEADSSRAFTEEPHSH